MSILPCIVSKNDDVYIMDEIMNTKWIMIVKKGIIGSNLYDNRKIIEYVIFLDG